MEAVQNIARRNRSRRRIILPFSSGRILSYFILPHPTLSYFFTHTMIFLGGNHLKWLLYAKALLRGERSAQQTEPFQRHRTQTAKQSGIIPCEVTVPYNLHGMQAVQNIARESRFTLSYRRIILPHFSRVRFYPTLSYLILLYPTFSLTP